MATSEVVLALRVVAELLRLSRRLFREIAGRPITKAELDAAFARADAADAKWAAANEVGADFDRAAAARADAVNAEEGRPDGQ